ncbi:MAG TPA: porphobilinogen synthase [Opitutaceae bacterium]
MPNPFKLNLVHRPRRLRRTPALRAMVEDTFLRPKDLVAPLFVIDGRGRSEAVASMPGVVRHTLADLVKECRALRKLGILSVALFPKIEARLKDGEGTAALREDALILRAVRAVKDAVPEMVVMTDIALDPYTSHGHDGVLNRTGTDVDNDRTVGILASMAVLHAGAGVDLVAPSDMMDGRIGAIRKALDAAGREDTAIMAYTAKYASAYYGPFRDAVGSASAAGTRALDKRTYQLNPANRREALVETKLDDAEGADVLMVKPAGLYLDVIHAIRRATLRPVAAYQVSGEYSQIHAAAKLGWLDLAACRRESLTAIKRAGADLILTYFAREMAAELGGA